MKKHFYLAAAALLSMAATMNAQQVITEDTEFTDPASWGSHVFDRDITIAGATVTFANEAMNTSAFHTLYVDTVRLYDGAKIVMFDSPDMWYPDEATREEWGSDLDDNDGNLMTQSSYVYKIMGDATIVCDSKGVIGGKIMSEPNCESSLTLVVGDSTVINADFFGFTGKLNIQYKEGVKSNTLFFGGVFPGYCVSCKNNLSNPSCKCWCTIPWVMEVPDNILLSAEVLTLPTYTDNAGNSIAPSSTIWSNQHTAFPQIIGKHSIYAPATLTLKPLAEATYDLQSWTGGGDTRNLEVFSGANVVFNGIIDYTCSYLYVRNKYVGLWINSDPATETLSNMVNCISVRNNDGFVGGIGNIGGNGIDCKSGVTTHIRPGAGFDLIGDLTINGNLWLQNNNALDVDFGANGNHDRLMMPNPEGKCNVSGENIRLWIQLLDEFYTAPKAGDYKVINAAAFIPNTVYETDTTGIRFGELDAAAQDEIVTKALTDSLITFPNSALSEAELKDSLKTAWANKFEWWANEKYKDRDTLFYNISKIDTLSWEIKQKVVWMANKREDGSSLDSLPAGYSWYPTEWDNMGYDSLTLVTMRDSLINSKFFANGVISIYGPGYKEGNIILPPTAAEDEATIEGVLDEKRVVSSQVYDAEGKAVPSPVTGVNIIRTKYSDGTETTRKIIGIGND